MGSKFGFAGLPAYEGGSPIDEIFNCGGALADDTDSATPEDAYMQIVRDTSEDEFLAYCRKLESEGFTAVYDRGNSAGLYRQYERGGRLVYTYYIYAERTTRIISEGRTCTVVEFSGGGENTLGDTALCAFLPARAALSLPLPAVGAMSVYCALLGESLRLHGMYDTFRIAAIGNAPYIVTVTAGGAAKRVGQVDGFSNSARANDPYARWQNVLLPVFLTAAVVFGVLSTLEANQNLLLAWNLSVLLASANLLAFPMVCALPLKRIAARLAKSGSAVAGYAGADAIRRSNCVILTDGDLFPPGTVTLAGLKVFGEESGKVISYAATMAHASESGLTKLFDDLLMRDGGFRERVEDVDFYEEGGVDGRIHGETVLFGTAGFMRKRGVNLPRNLGLKTGVFLSVDGTLIAVFAVKYMPAENVDWALHALHHSRITPVLAVRDGNITPALLKRKFGTDARAVYPKMSTRLALSERGGGRPYALLMREGLMPYAEVVLGSKRLCRSARRCTLLTILASTAATLLAFYLTFVGAYSVLTPLSVLIFVLLWSLSALVDALLSDRY